MKLVTTLFAQKCYSIFPLCVFFCNTITRQRINCLCPTEYAEKVIWHWITDPGMITDGWGCISQSLHHLYSCSCPGFLAKLLSDASTGLEGNTRCDLRCTWFSDSPAKNLCLFSNLSIEGFKAAILWRTSFVRSVGSLPVRFVVDVAALHVHKRPYMDNIWKFQCKMVLSCQEILLPHQLTCVAYVKFVHDCAEVAGNLFKRAIKCCGVGNPPLS